MNNSAAPLLVSAPEPLDLPGWQAWLEKRIEQAWRPGEWDAQALLFTGNYDNPRTVVSKCRTRACTSGVLAHTGRLCRRCGKALRASGLDLETFLATHVPSPVNRGFVTDTCRVRRGEDACGRVAATKGLCRSHFSQYYDYNGRHPDVELSRWLQMRPVPLAALPPCRVPGCGHQQFAASVELCIYHHRSWQAHRREQNLPVGADVERKVWLERQTPYLTGAQFSLRHLGPVLRKEILYVLQHRDRQFERVHPGSTRWIIDGLAEQIDIQTGTWLSLDRDRLLARWTGDDVKAHIRYWDRTIRLSYDEFLGLDPLAKQQLDLVAVGLRSPQTRSGMRVQNRVVDVEQIQQPWLRHVFVEWVRQAEPTNNTFGCTFRACVLASQALLGQPHGGHEPQRLQLADMDVAVRAIQTAPKLNGEPSGAKHRQSLLARYFAVLDFGRATGLMDSVGGGFARQRHHRVLDVADDDEAGRAIPESVIRQLDSQLDLLGRDLPYGHYAAQDVAAMFQTAYIVLRDTGRRPREVYAMAADCLESDGKDVVLVWNNHKSRRLRRRLPIVSQTAEAIRAWQRRCEQLPIPAECRAYLFPSSTTRGGTLHMNGQSLWQALRSWIDSLPRLDSETLDEDGSPMPFDRSLIYPYAFRHSYAQRHADAGVPVDILRDLMDHRSVNTTMGYYKISQKRKREAITTMRLTVTDRTGTPAPMSSNTAYEARSVAVPFGNCIEPSNVKAGGKGCRIRFQCAGCGFYRPDPSYLPAIEDHIRSLKADREAASAMVADDFVIRNLTDQIDAFRGIATTIKDHLAALPDQERERIEDASRVLRRARAAEGRNLLPLMATQRESTDS